MRLVFLTVAVAAATAVAAPMLGNAQGVPQTVQLTKVDVIKVATGFRASKVIGSSVVNDAGDTVGRVDDIIIARKARRRSSCWRWAVSSASATSWSSCPTSS